ncbi:MULTISPECIES: DUF2202 domain-containing protein [Acidithiobacillus]|uniref:DUF2202 domain-containing protein n=2 Tax=Acidithiobacillus ferridurans TaxID=1232575 RepID=A0A2Z6IFV8_ACIFI|nr:MULTISPECIES: DUF2202 domain-containing protein [Acidithiobacillus]BBF64541.1 hypothetical protein AFERRID_07590 [Acidithiobacillus ferridurans]
MDNRELSTQGRTCPTCGVDLPGLNSSVDNNLPNNQNIRGGQGNRGRGAGGGRGMGGGGMGGGGRFGMAGGGRGLGGGAWQSAVPAQVGSDFVYLDRTAHREEHLAQIRSTVAAYRPGELSVEERDDLLLMREEEKIARDVYLRLYDRWGIRPFDNISGAEQAHMDAILALLKHYGLSDPAQGLELGRFHRAELQDLYDRLVQQGLQSRENAIRVGLLIEELDIADLQNAAHRAVKPEILAVYAELERGSRNHLRAFYRWKQGLGIDYQPTHLLSDDFERIAHSAQEDCQ